MLTLMVVGVDLLIPPVDVGVDLLIPPAIVLAVLAVVVDVVVPRRIVVVVVVVIDDVAFGLFPPSLGGRVTTAGFIVFFVFFF